MVACCSPGSSFTDTITYHDSDIFSITIPSQSSYPAYVRAKLTHKGMSMFIQPHPLVPTSETHQLSNTQVSSECEGDSRLPSLFVWSLHN
jgi:hypothetical protein